jgi:hypothetical protein
VLFTERITPYSENYTKLITTLFSQNREIILLKPMVGIISQYFKRLTWIRTTVLTLSSGMEKKTSRNNLHWFKLISNILWYLDPMLGNDRETMRQLLLLGSGPLATVEVLLEGVFSMWSAPRLYHATDRVQFIWVEWSELVGEWVSEWVS